ncbi:4-(cytidine 5'-diphospho)-2-C-methyl-D-erythritol kinase [Nocardioides sp.]|uniref:4-(cytidine 5'-diphospho)-2-C-methyl-D-erythritol kinase n=1 Tax=Nocardioides sp. TaxID=35761 RepID=UPI003D114099
MSAGVTRSISVRTAAKVNLHLGVGAPREDGFHPLSTVYQAIGLYDDVTVRRSPTWNLSLETAEHVNAEAIPLIDNIVHHAARALGERHGRDLVAAVQIDKNIPVAGGLAGGSADAAGALVALDRLFGLQTSDEDLLEIAAGLGSDVPFALMGGTAIGTGRGELVEPVDDPGTWWWVAVTSRDGLSTPEVYRHFDRLFPDADPEPKGIEAVLAALASGEPLLLARSLHNDLQDAALDLRPDLARLIEEGEAAGALRGIISGSGPTVVFLAEDADSARHLGADLLGAGHEIALAAPGPVSGATLVSL